MRTYQPTDQDKLAIVPHVLYEIGRTFFHEGDIITNEGWILKLLHGRVLIDFFQKTAKTADGDDVLAEDFGFSATALNLDPDLPFRLNKDLAHLTYSRLRHTSDSKKWQLDQLRPLLDRSIEFTTFLLSQTQLILPSDSREQCTRYKFAMSSLRQLMDNEISFPQAGSSQIGL